MCHEQVNRVLSSLHYPFVIAGSSNLLLPLIMSICTRVVVAVTFEQVDNAPDTETGTERDNEGLKNGDCLFKKCHIVS